MFVSRRYIRRLSTQLALQKIKARNFEREALDGAADMIRYGQHSPACDLVHSNGECSCGYARAHARAEASLARGKARHTSSVNLSVTAGAGRADSAPQRPEAVQRKEKHEEVIRR